LWLAFALFGNGNPLLGNGNPLLGNSNPLLDNGNPLLGNGNSLIFIIIFSTQATATTIKYSLHLKQPIL
jgi:hypothetical protein